MPTPETLKTILDFKILDFNELRDDGVAVVSAGPHANHLLHAPDR